MKATGNVTCFNVPRIIFYNIVKILYYIYTIYTIFVIDFVPNIFVTYNMNSLSTLNGSFPSVQQVSVIFL